MHQPQLPFAVAVGFQQAGVIAELMGLLRDRLRDERIVAAGNQGQKHRDGGPVKDGRSVLPLVSQRFRHREHARAGFLRERRSGPLTENHGYGCDRHPRLTRDILNGRSFVLHRGCPLSNLPVFDTILHGFRFPCRIVN